MGSLGFTLYQLAELAGLSCAQSINHYIEHKYPEKPKEKYNILTICGPGSNILKKIDNGADGLIASRHMSLFKYNVSVYYPKPNTKEVYKVIYYVNIESCPAM